MNSLTAQLQEAGNLLETSKQQVAGKDAEIKAKVCSLSNFRLMMEQLQSPDGTVTDS
jgi:hypothetical protein